MATWKRGRSPFLEGLRHHADKGLPCGVTLFVKTLEMVTERLLRYQAQGQAKNVAD